MVVIHSKRIQYVLGICSSPLPAKSSEMREGLYADIRSYSFNEFVDFLFDRPLQPESEDRSRSWFFNTQVSFDPARVCEYYVRLFRQPSFLIDHFSREQLEQGFRATTRRSLSCSAKCIIWNTDLPFQARAECVKSMFYLFPAVFSIDPLGFNASMWWDAFCFDWECGIKRRARGGEDLKMQDVLFETLSEVLTLDSAICRGSALHGLEHLHHPETRMLIGTFLSDHPDLAMEWKDYLQRICRDKPLWMQRT